MKCIEQRIKESLENGNMEDIPLVDKVWGREIWVVNKFYCGKILELDKGGYCSIHYHKYKDETFLVTEGEVLMNVQGKEWVMKPGHCQYIPPYTKHRFTGLAKKSTIIEFSTHHEDSDSYRIEGSGKIKKKWWQFWK